MRKWGKFRRLPAEEKATLFAALALLLGVRVGLRALGLQRVLATLDRRLTLAPAEGTDTDFLALRTARLVAVAARLAGGTCLARSIVLVSLLKRRGIPAELRIGVRKTEGGFEAHAWVEAAGTILNDGPDIAERFTAFDRNFALARASWR
jgi:transglutaminase-like putative cysteine protease